MASNNTNTNTTGRTINEIWRAVHGPGASINLAYTLEVAPDGKSATWKDRVTGEVVTAASISTKIRDVQGYLAWVKPQLDFIYRGDPNNQEFMAEFESQFMKDGKPVLYVKTLDEFGDDVHPVHAVKEDRAGIYKQLRGLSDSLEVALEKISQPFNVDNFGHIIIDFTA